MNEKITYTIADAGEIDELFTMYQFAIQTMCKAGIEQWDEYYPDAECVNKVVAIFLKKFMQLFLCPDSKLLLHELYTALPSCRTSAPDERTLLH